MRRMDNSTWLIHLRDELQGLRTHSDKDLRAAARWWQGALGALVSSAAAVDEASATAMRDEAQGFFKAGLDHWLRTAARAGSDTGSRELIAGLRAVMDTP